MEETGIVCFALSTQQLWSVISSAQSHETGMRTDFEKKNSNLCSDTADFTSSPSYLGQNCWKITYNWYVPIQSPALAAPPPPKICKCGKICKIPISDEILFGGLLQLVSWSLKCVGDNVSGVKVWAAKGLIGCIRSFIPWGGRGFWLSGGWSDVLWHFIFFSPEFTRFMAHVEFLLSKHNNFPS